MSDIIYNPAEVGNEILNTKGKIIRIRKYHLTDDEIAFARMKWLSEISESGVGSEIRNKAGDYFFNPYRRGIYHYQIQTLFLLGANEWHSLRDVVNKIEEYTLTIDVDKSMVKKYGFITAWDKFKGKRSRQHAQNSKDYIGRIQENMVFFQRLSKLHPYGYKLHQAHAAVDIKRVSKPGFDKGKYSYRLSTYSTMEESLPIKDFSRFKFPSYESKYVSHKFVGTIITKDRILKNGKLVSSNGEMPNG